MIIYGTDLLMIRGDTENLSIACDNYKLKAGDMVEFTVRQNYDAPKVIYKKQTSFTDEGTAEIVILPTDTQLLIPKVYKYDVCVTLSDGTVTTIIPPSNFTIKGDITHAN